MNRTLVVRMWLPTRGRLSKRIARNAEHRRFAGCVYGLASVLGFVYLVFEGREN
jgi:hypothetical protein